MFSLSAVDRLCLLSNTPWPWPTPARVARAIGGFPCLHKRSRGPGGRSLPVGVGSAEDKGACCGRGERSYLGRLGYRIRVERANCFGGVAGYPRSRWVAEDGTAGRSREETSSLSRLGVHRCLGTLGLSEDPIIWPKVGRCYSEAMDVSNILASIDAEIAKLKAAKETISALQGDQVKTTSKSGPGRPKSSTPSKLKSNRTMTPEGRARIAAAQKARWAKKNADEDTADTA